MLHKIEPRFTDNDNNAFLLRAFHLDMSELLTLLQSHFAVAPSPQLKSHHLSDRKVMTFVATETRRNKWSSHTYACTHLLTCSFFTKKCCISFNAYSKLRNQVPINECAVMYLRFIARGAHFKECHLPSKIHSNLYHFATN